MTDGAEQFDERLVRLAAELRLKWQDQVAKRCTRRFRGNAAVDTVGACPMRSSPTLAWRAVYDAFDGPRDDLAAYVAIAGELGADRVLDVGCGTGCLAIALAGTGRTVSGVDPAAASLDVARSKDGSAAVTWIHGDAAAVPAASADLAVMTGNVAQVFRTDEDWAQVLRAIGGRARPARVPGLRNPAPGTPGLGGMGGRDRPGPP